MDTCPRCGAARSPDLTWCGQCYARFDPPPSHVPDDAVVLVTGGGADDEMTLPGWVRALMTVGALAGGITLIVGFGPWWDLGRPMWALGAVLLTLYASLSGVLVARLWSPQTFTRREEHLVMLDPHAIEQVEQRQRDLVVRDEPAR
jgi:hypothetical protein